jgi:hypothetical protein
VAGTESGPDRVVIVEGNRSPVQAPVLGHLGEQAVGAAVCVAGDDDVVTGLAHRTQQRVLGGQTARERQAAPAALDRGEALLQRIPGGIARPAVLVPEARLPHRVLGVRAGLVDRRHHGAGARIRLLAGVDGEGVEAVVASLGALGHAAQG